MFYYDSRMFTCTMDMAMPMPTFRVLICCLSGTSGVECVSVKLQATDHQDTFEAGAFELPAFFSLKEELI